MAGTPFVAGAAALLKQRFPLLTAKQIVDLMFATATDLGAPGTDAVYGRGLLNISAAMSPLGWITVPLPDGTAPASSIPVFRSGRPLATP